MDEVLGAAVLLVSGAVGAAVPVAAEVLAADALPGAGGVVEALAGDDGLALADEPPTGALDVAAGVLGFGAGAVDEAPTGGELDAPTAAVLAAPPPPSLPQPHRTNRLVSVTLRKVLLVTISLPIGVSVQGEKAHPGSFAPGPCSAKSAETESSFQRPEAPYF